jgi:hypothetical protein
VGTRIVNRLTPKYVAVAELRRNPNRFDQEIARVAGWSAQTVRKARAALLEADAIPRRPPVNDAGFRA